MQATCNMWPLGNGPSGNDFPAFAIDSLTTQLVSTAATASFALLKRPYWDSSPLCGPHFFSPRLPCTSHIVLHVQSCNDAWDCIPLERQVLSCISGRWYFLTEHCESIVISTCAETVRVHHPLFRSVWKETFLVITAYLNMLSSPRINSASFLMRARRHPVQTASLFTSASRSKIRPVIFFTNSLSWKLELVRQSATHSYSVYMSKEIILQAWLLRFTMDGASVMMRRYRGLATVMRERTNSDQVIIHCMNHKLELAV